MNRGNVIQFRVPNIEPTIDDCLSCSRFDGCDGPCTKLGAPSSAPSGSAVVIQFRQTVDPNKCEGCGLRPYCDSPDVCAVWLDLRPPHGVVRGWDAGDDTETND